MSGSKSTIKKKRVLLKKLAKHDAMWHPDSRLVFKSKKDKLVIGRLDEENKLVRADELTWELCEQPVLDDTAKALLAIRNAAIQQNFTIAAKKH